MRNLVAVDESKIRSEVHGFIASTFLGPGANGELADDDLLFDSGIIDSIGAMELLGFLQEHFRIEILDEELFPENFSSVDRIAVFVLGKLGGTTPRKNSHR